VYTQCPDCGTVFRVTAAVLRAAQGHVRCGVCDANFDAIQFLSDTVGGEPAQTPAPAPLPSSGPTASAPAWLAAAPSAEATGAPVPPQPPVEPPLSPRSGIATGTPPAMDEDRALAEIAAALAREAQASHGFVADGAGAPDDSNVLEPADVEDILLDAEGTAGEIPDSALEFNLPPGEWDRVFVVDTESSAITPLDIDFEMLANAAEGAAPGTIAEAAFAGAFEPLADTAPEAPPHTPPEPSESRAAAVAADAAAEPAAQLVPDVATKVADESPAQFAPEVPVEVAAGLPADVAPEVPAGGAVEPPAALAPEVPAEAMPGQPAEPVAEIAVDSLAEPPAAVAIGGAERPFDEDSLSRTDESAALVAQWSEDGALEEAAADPAPIPRLVPTLLPTQAREPAPTATEASAAAPGDDADDETGDQTLAELMGKAPSAAIEPQPRRTMVAFASVSALLALTLGAQLVHHFREPLAGAPLVGRPLAVLYARLGTPIEPRWDLSAYDIKQWGAAADNAPGALRLRASVINRAPRSQPYPLLRVTLEDRFGGKVARREFTPAEYLPGRTAPSQLLAPGARADADLSFADPGSQAVGFELDVCLPRGGALACGGEQKTAEGG